MSANTLNIASIELVSTQRVAPLNGAPSSADHNDSAREVLTDMASISEFLNGTVLPLLNCLPARWQLGLCLASRLFRSVVLRHDGEAAADAGRGDLPAQPDRSGGPGADGGLVSACFGASDPPGDHQSE